METTAAQFDPSTAAAKQRLLTMSLIGTFLGLVPTVYAAVISNSVVLVADLLRCLAEFTAILFSWIIVKKISRAEPAHYNYGFGKFEHLSSLAVSAALIITSLISLFVGLKRLVTPELLENIGFGFLLGVSSVVANSFFWSRNYILESRSPSPVTDAQWRLFRAKTFATLVVSISLGASLLFHAQPWTFYVDPAGSMVLAGFMMYSAVTMLSSAVPILVDGAVEENIQRIILATLIEHEGRYRAFEKVRTRRAGRNFHVEIFLSFDGAQSFAEVHSTVMFIKGELQERLPEADLVVVPALSR